MTKARTVANTAIRVVPVNEASWDDLRTVFGSRGETSRCQCQWFRIPNAGWNSVPVAERADRLREQTRAGHPGAGATSGLIAYLDGEPVGWCAVASRTAHPRLPPGLGR